MTQSGEVGILVQVDMSEATDAPVRLRLPARGGAVRVTGVLDHRLAGVGTGEEASEQEIWCLATEVGVCLLQRLRSEGTGAEWRLRGWID